MMSMSEKKGKLSLTLHRKQPSPSLSLNYRSESKNQQPVPYVGLKNLGNTCYCNAVLQALRYTPGVSQTVKKQDNVCEDQPIIKALKQLMQDLDANANAVNPLTFLELLRQNGQFTRGVQHDAQELLNHLLTDGLIPKQQITQSLLLDYKPSSVSKEAEKPCGRSKLSAVADLFQGKLALQTRCFNCDHCTNRTEPFLHVTVPVTSQGLPGFPCTSPQPVCNSSAASVSLSWCLSKFMSQERLAGDNKFWCERCNHLVEAERSIVFSDLPSILTVHLNRFSVQHWGKAVSKVANSVAIPMTLSLKPWSTKECVARDSMYQLHAAVLHTGASCHSGHYTALVQAAGQWLHYDDESVTSISAGAVQQLMLPLPVSLASPYILFYSL